MLARYLKFDVSGRDERALFPVAILTCLVLFATLIGMAWSSSSANRQQAELEIQAVNSALEAERRAFSDEARATAERIVPTIAATRTPDSEALPVPTPTGQGWLVDIDWFAPGSDAKATEIRPLLSAAAPIVSALVAGERLRGPLSGEADGASWGVPEARVAVVDGRPVLVAVTPFLGPAQHAGRPALLTASPLDEQALARLARGANTQRIDVARGPATEGTGSIQVGSDDNTVALQWSLLRPGDEIVNKNAFFLIAFAAIFAALIVFHSRRITQEAADSERKARAVAGQDSLTGLPNRFMFNRLLENEVERVKRSVNERGTAVLLFDIDRLAEVNDTLGKDVADRLIIAMTRRIVGLLRSSGRLARMGGDEFAILQTDIVGPRDAEILARRIIDALSEPIELDDQKVYVSVSIGVALCPHDADTPEELVHRADLALYRAKNEGRNRYCFFEQKLGDQLKLRKTVEDDLRAAIEEGSLLVQYQPVMEHTGKRMVGVEALVRWPHPIHGMISPMNFIALAEECGLILPLGEWVLRRALHDVKQWPGLRVAVNVSGIQFRSKGFVPMLTGMLDEIGVDPSQLELELTESILLADADSAEEAMIELRAMGVRLALDDFGTGYSSLIYLRRFAFDKIKIDKSFLDAMEATGESAIIVHSIVHLGRALGLTVTAEGVESPEQHRFLQALGCHELQGYLFSKPVSAAEISRRLEAQSDASPGPQKAVA